MAEETPESVIAKMKAKGIEIDPEQWWFWTDEWQAAEKQADIDLANGDYEEFDNIDDFINSLSTPEASKPEKG